MGKFVALFLCLLFTCHEASCQIDGVLSEYRELDATLVEKIDVNKRSRFHNISFTNPYTQDVWHMELTPTYMLSRDYKCNNTLDRSHNTALPMTGYIEGVSESKVSITFNDDFVEGMIYDGKTWYMVEPKSYYHLGEGFIIYPTSALVHKKAYGCGTKHRHMPRQEVHSRSNGECLEVEWSIVSDYSMYKAYGSVQAVENHNIAVANNIQLNYDNEFDDAIIFSITNQRVITDIANDPWKDMSSLTEMLGAFRDWGVKNLDAFDIASLWTDRKFGSSTIGVAYVGAVCSGYGFNCLQNFTSNAQTKRAMVAHEIGHNFGANHDSGGSNIMSPVVSNTNTWSSLSRSAIQAFYKSRKCFGSCRASSVKPEAFFTINKTVCANTPIRIENASKGHGLSYKWNFESGSPAVSSLRSPMVEFVTEGSHKVELTVSNEAGSSTYVSTVQVVARPALDIDPQIDGSRVTIVNNSSNVHSHRFDFGDGTVYTDANPVHVYKTSGVYSIKYTASNDCMTRSVTHVVSVTEDVSADFSASSHQGCVPFRVSYTNLSSPSAESYRWIFEGGEPSVSTLKNPVVTYAAPGRYPVTLEVSNGKLTDKETKTDYIVVGDKKNAAFQVYSVANGKYEFVQDEISSSDLTWDFGDGITSSEIRPTHKYDREGSYTVTLSKSNECGSAVSTQQVAYYSAPRLDVQYSENDICEGGKIAFSNAHHSSSYRYFWTFDGGVPSTSTEARPSVVFPERGRYSVSLAISNSKGQDAVTLDDVINVNPLPRADYSYSSTGRKVAFKAVGQDAARWDFGDGHTSTAQNPVHTYSKDGIYRVTLTKNNDCSSSKSVKTITVVSDVVADFRINTTEACIGEKMFLESTSSSNATSLEWIVSGVLTASQDGNNAEVTFAKAGTYDVTLVAANSSYRDTLTKKGLIRVHGEPKADFILQKDVKTIQLTNTSTSADSYKWSFGDGKVSFGKDPVHTYNKGGEYTITLEANGKCGKDKATAVVEVYEEVKAGFEVSDSFVCIGEKLQLHNTSMGSISSYEWILEGATSDKSSESSPTIQYNQKGLYSITLVVHGKHNSDTIVQKNIVTVGAVPNAEFETQVDLNVVRLKNTTDGDQKYIWSMGDGKISNEKNPVHTYAQDGKYDILLTAYNSCGSSNHKSNVTIATEVSAGFTAENNVICQGEAIAFKNGSSGNISTYEWSFEGAVTPNSTEKNPSVVFKTPGSYDVQLVVSNAVRSDTIVRKDFVRVAPSPRVGFSFVQDFSKVQFTHSCQYANSYSWSFGDGGSSTAPHPNHRYEKDGKYSVQLTAKNRCGEASVTKDVTIAAQVKADFATKNRTICGASEVAFSNLSSGKVNFYKWTFEGAEPSFSSAKSPKVKYLSAGTYDVTLIVGNGDRSDTITKKDYIKVVPAPEADFDLSITKGSVLCTNKSSHAGSYHWSFGDGDTSVVMNPEHRYTKDGKYTIQLVAKNHCGESSFSKDITIVTPVKAGFVLDATQGCAPLKTTLRNTSSSNVDRFEWIVEGPTRVTSQESSPQIILEKEGSYTVTQIVHNDLYSDTIVRPDAFVVSPEAQVSFGYDTYLAQLSLSNTSTGISEYLWSFGDGTTSSDRQPVHRYDASGEYTVQLVGKGVCGADTATADVSVAMLPQALFQSEQLTICPDESITFDNLSSDEAKKYHWIFEGGIPATSQEKIPTVTYSNPGVYDVTLVVSGASGKDTLTQNGYIEVVSQPKVDVAIHGNGRHMSFEIKGQTLEVDSVSWDLGDGTLVSGLSGEHDYEEGEVFTITATVWTSCGVRYLSEEYIIKSLSANDFVSNVSIYPNPVYDSRIVIQAEHFQHPELASYTLYDMLGHELRTGGFSNKGDAIIYVDDLPNATYLLQCIVDGKPFMEKVIVVR